MKNYITGILVLIASSVFNPGTLAQGKEIDVNISTNPAGSWYVTPWVWVVGAVIFIILIVAILKGGRRRPGN